MKIKFNYLQGFISAGRNMELDPYLAAYPLDRLKLWKELSDYISLSVMQKLEV